MFDFEHISNKDFKNNDRDDFANTVCKILYSKFSGKLDKIYNSGELKLIYDQFEEHVRNIYELIDTHIPLFSFYELKREEADKGKGNWDMDEKEFDEAMIRTRKACIDYYCA